MIPPVARSPGQSPAGPSRADHIFRSAVSMTALTALSRVTGFVRILVVAAVLGTTFLGNTYQSANTVPNLLFELFAAGLLQAVLIPSLVELLDRGDRDEAEHVVGSVLGLAACGLGILAAAGMLLGPLIMRVLVSGVASPEVRDAQVRLGSFFLWFFLPQVLLYAGAFVATAVLNARGQFALPVSAPVVNNVVVIATYVVFWMMRDGQAPSLDLSTPQKVVLAGGTTLGVLAFCSLPVIAAVRGGFSLRLGLDYRHPEVRRLFRRGRWAALYLAMTQFLLAVVLVLANRVEGGVVAYQVAYTFFLLPHALFAIPLATALYPTIARQAHRGDGEGYNRSLDRGLRGLGFLLLPATAAFVTLAHPLARLVLFGSGQAGARQVAHAVMGLAPGLLGYGAFLLFTRAFYAIGDTRTPAMVNGGVAAGGAVLMVAGFALAGEGEGVAGVALAHSLAYLAGAVALFSLLRQRRLLAVRAGLPRALGVSAAAATLAAAVAWIISAVIPGGGRPGALADLVLAGGLAAATYLLAQRGLGGLGVEAAWWRGGPATDQHASEAGDSQPTDTRPNANQPSASQPSASQPSADQPSDQRPGLGPYG